MSIYCSMPGVWADGCPGEELCTGCDECMVGAPYVYEGSHIIVGPDSQRGGAVHWAIPASHIPTASEPRDSEHDDRWPAHHSYIRLGIHTHDGHSADIVLDRRQVAHLTAEWTRWLTGPFIDDGFPPPPTKPAALAAMNDGELAR